MIMFWSCLKKLSFFMTCTYIVNKALELLCKCCFTTEVYYSNTFSLKVCGFAFRTHTFSLILFVFLHVIIAHKTSENVIRRTSIRLIFRHTFDYLMTVYRTILIIQSISAVLKMIFTVCFEDIKVLSGIIQDRHALIWQFHN